MPLPKRNRLTQKDRLIINNPDLFALPLCLIKQEDINGCKLSSPYVKIVIAPIFVLQKNGTPT